MSIDSGTPSREVYLDDALKWLQNNPAPVGASVVTSLPDCSEVPELSFDAWKVWFCDLVKLIIHWVPRECHIIFFQSDIRKERVGYVDKSYLVQRAAEECPGCYLVWHKIICRKPPGTIARGRSSFSHMLCFEKVLREAPRRPGPEVIADAGTMPWSRAMGSNACMLACKFLQDESPFTKCVVDPFCGQGSMLACANSFGFAAIGVELNTKRCRAARMMTWPPTKHYSGRGAPVHDTQEPLSPGGEDQVGDGDLQEDDDG
eukprot:PhF_6_TR31691/c0_g1_i1/m.46627